MTYIYFEKRVVSDSLFSPHHFVDDADVALDDFYHLGADVFVHVIRDRDTVVTLFAEFHCGIYCLKEALGVDAGNDEIALLRDVPYWYGCK